MLRCLLHRRQIVCRQQPSTSSLTTCDQRLLAHNHFLQKALFRLLGHKIMTAMLGEIRPPHYHSRHPVLRITLLRLQMLVWPWTQRKSGPQQAEDLKSIGTLLLQLRNGQTLLLSFFQGCKQSGR